MNRFRRHAKVLSNYRTKRLPFDDTKVQSNISHKFTEKEYKEYSCLIQRTIQNSPKITNYKKKYKAIGKPKRHENINNKLQETF